MPLQLYYKSRWTRPSTPALVVVTIKFDYINYVDLFGYFVGGNTTSVRKNVKLFQRNNLWVTNKAN